MVGKRILNDWLLETQDTGFGQRQTNPILDGLNRATEKEKVFTVLRRCIGPVYCTIAHARNVSLTEDRVGGRDITEAQLIHGGNRG